MAAGSEPSQKEVRRQPHTRETPLTETKCVTMTSTGGCGVVKVERKPVPIAKEGEILIDVEACGFGFNDIMIRQGFLDNMPKTPFTMGSECSGVVIGLGTGSSGFKIGDHVIAFPEVGAWAEVIAVPERHVFKIPDNLPYMPFPECSAFLVNYVSAYIMLFGIANLEPGQSVLVHSAAGGLGMAIISLCRTINDVTIYATAAREKHIVLNGLVNHVFDSKADYAALIKEIDPEGVDLVLESRGGDDYYKALNLVKPLGMCLSYGTSNAVSGDTKPTFNFLKTDPKVTVKELCAPNRAIAGFSLRELLYRKNGLEKIRTAYEKVSVIMERHNLIPPIDTSFALEDADLAMRRMQNRLNMGRIVLSPFVDAIRREPPQKSSVTKSSSTESNIDSVEHQAGTSGEPNEPQSDTSSPADGKSSESSAEPATGPVSTVKDLEHSVAVGKPEEGQASEQAKPKPESQPAGESSNDQDKQETKPEQGFSSEQPQENPEGQSAENEQPNPEEKLKEGADALHDIPEEQGSEEATYEESHE